MLCPDIKDECVGESCRDWDQERKTCKKLYYLETSLKQSERAAKLYEEQAKRHEDEEKEARDYRKTITEMMNRMSLFARLELSRLARDPTLSPEEKEIIQKALQAPSSEAAEKLLKEAGLID